jgi:8-amino-7-oxononanoate synthase
MGTLDDALKLELQSLREAALWRELRRVDSATAPSLHLQGQEVLSFASNDYLGLASHPALREAAIRAVERWGVGASSSRLISGSWQPHHELEDTLAAWKGTEAALSFASGYTTALGAIPALLGSDDVIILDKRVHACCVDAARLSGARLRVFRHNDPEDLKTKLSWATGLDRKMPLKPGETAASIHRARRILIVTESVFSMDGDLAPLRDILDLKDQFGAWLMLDEAHAVGLFGAQRSGLAEAFEIANRVEIHMGTLGKALGSAGGYIAGSRALIDLLVNRARSFIFSTAPLPAQAAAAKAAIELIQGPEGASRCARVWTLVDRLKNELTHAGWPPGVVRSTIVPLIVGEEDRAVSLAEALKSQGLFVPPIRYPTVARGAARLRISLSADHTAEHLQRLAKALQSYSKT